MSYEYHIHHDHRLVYKKVWGSYTDEDSRVAHEYWDQIRKTGDINDYSELQDLTEVVDYGISVDQMKALALRYREESEQRKAAGKPSNKKIAYVVPSRLAYGTARIYGALIEETGMTFRVFDALEDGCEWLQLNEAACRNILIRLSP